MTVSLCCTECSNYFRLEAFEPADVIPVCYDCAERAQSQECAHDHVRVVRFDAGRCTETGYSDSGELIECTDCGFQEVA